MYQTLYFLLDVQVHTHQVPYLALYQIGWMVLRSRTMKTSSGWIEPRMRTRYGTCTYTSRIRIRTKYWVFHQWKINAAQERPWNLYLTGWIVLRLRSALKISIAQCACIPGAGTGLSACHCCESGMFIPDPDFSIPDPGSEFFPSRIPDHVPDPHQRI